MPTAARTTALLARMHEALEARWERRLHGLSLEPMAPGPGKRNHVLAATAGRRRYVVKVRRDVHDTAEREAWALRRLEGSVAPRLVAWWPGELGAARRSISGGCVVMAHARGEAPTARQLDLVARALALLHAHAPRRGPELLCPSSFGALLRYAADLAERLFRRRSSSDRRRAIERALRAQAARRVPELPRVRALCHGDLGWHNMRCEGERVTLLDFELAGIGDPAVDLMLMVARAPLSKRETEALLSTYLSHRRDDTLRARCALIGPLVGLVSALSATLVSAKRGREELDRALARARG